MTNGLYFFNMNNISITANAILCTLLYFSVNIKTNTSTSDILLHWLIFPIRDAQLLITEQAAASQNGTSFYAFRKQTYRMKRTSFKVATSCA